MTDPTPSPAFARGGTIRTDKLISTARVSEIFRRLLMEPMLGPAEHRLDYPVFAACSAHPLSEDARCVRAAHVMAGLFADQGRP